MSDGSSTWQFTYDADGLRTKKTNGSTTYEYVYNGGQLVYVKSGSDTLRIVYDGSSPFRLDYNGTAYHYVTNLQGDVIALLDDMGEKVVEYTYDAWGNLLSITGEEASTVGIANPLRYRGYCYDVETGFYYVSSRYYDPEVGRFISADTTDILGVSSDLYDKNLYAYCDNNPVIRIDSTGYVWETIFDVASLGVSVVEVAINPTDVWAWAGLVGDAIDLIPFVTGVGEVTRAVKTYNKVEDVVASAKNLKNSKKVSTSVGTYEILYASGKNYVGKGDFGRAIQSAVDHAKEIELNAFKGDTVISIRWKASSDAKSAFIEEFGLQTLKGVKNATTYNKIWSPGKKYYLNAGGRLPWML